MKTTGRHRHLLVATTLSVFSILAALLPAGGSALPQAPPRATGEPTITGTPVVGNILTASNGSFSGTGPFNYTLPVAPLPRQRERRQRRGLHRNLWRNVQALHRPHRGRRPPSARPRDRRQLGRHSNRNV